MYILLIFAHTIRLHVFVSYSFSRPPVPCEAISTFCLGGSVSTLANLQYHFVVIKILYSFLPFFHCCAFICMCSFNVYIHSPYFAPYCLSVCQAPCCAIFFVSIFLFLHLFCLLVFAPYCLCALGGLVPHWPLCNCPQHPCATTPQCP